MSAFVGELVEFKPFVFMFYKTVKRYGGPYSDDDDHDENAKKGKARLERFEVDWLTKREMPEITTGNGSEMKREMKTLMFIITLISYRWKVIRRYLPTTVSPSLGIIIIKVNILPMPHMDIRQPIDPINPSC